MVLTKLNNDYLMSTENLQLSGKIPGVDTCFTVTLCLALCSQTLQRYDVQPANVEDL